ncbi:MAG TPA: alkaline phosphatase family protein [Pyrinomonadaceae bacterium]
MSGRRQTVAARAGGKRRAAVGAHLLRRRGALFLLASGFWLLAYICSLPPASAQAKRLVVVKVDGLPYAEVDKFVRERDPRTGKSALPWIDYLFYQRGTRVENFYVRGMSLSGPSWSLLDTGQHLQIKGNAEFDRFTLHTYDYLNFIPVWVASVAGHRVDMPGSETLDELGIPLLFDSYPNDARYQGFQTYQRGVRWTTMKLALENYFKTRSPRELFDEWTLGVGGRNMIMEQLERELIERLQDPRYRYLDYYTTEFDHFTHHNRDRATHLAAMQELDSIIGRIWAGVERSPLAADTAFVVVSDHGTNSDERYYSQGFNLVRLLGSPVGGGHHVVTKRRLLNDYAIKGTYPLVSLVTTTTPDSYYLKGQSTDYPTALLEFDGNERAGIHLRDSDLNLLHILLLGLQRRDFAPPLRRAAADAFFATLERRRPDWQRTLDELQEELGALRHLIERQAAIVAARPKKWTPADRAAGRDREAARAFARLDSWQADERAYTEYARTLTNLLALRRETFAPATLRVPDVIAKGAMGEHNTLQELQRYVVGLAPGGLQLAPDGALDFERSFARVDYPALLRAQTVRNNVQPGLDNHPVDFVAMELPADAVLRATDDPDLRADDCVWLNGGEDRQALVLARRERGGTLLLRYVPVARLRQTADGALSFERPQWAAGFPLKMWEDARVQLPAGAERAAWLAGWHTDLDWLRALHLTDYSNGLIGIHEQFAHYPTPATAADVPGLARDEQLIRRFRRRQRALIETDLFVHASDHWNFDVRGFNPGGNHGSFRRVSTHSTFMLTGGANTRVPRGLAIEEPYDSLSFVPTVLTLTGQLPAPGAAVPATLSGGAARYPGRVITELFATPPRPLAPVAGGAAGGAH